MGDSPCGSGRCESRRAATPGRYAGPAVRLTRRGRRVRGVLVSTFLAGVLGVLPVLAPTAGVASQDRSAGRSHVMVKPGESLWAVAVRHAPTRDPSVTVEEIRRLNRLPGYVVHPGQRLRLP
jgi:hypothetical protein